VQIDENSREITFAEIDPELLAAVNRNEAIVVPLSLVPSTVAAQGSSHSVGYDPENWSYPVAAAPCSSAGGRETATTKGPSVVEEAKAAIPPKKKRKLITAP